MVTYTDATKVKSRFKDIDTNISDAEINQFINAAESIIDITMKKTARGTKVDFTFNSDKHGIIEDTASCLAAFNCISNQTTGESATITAARASLIGDFYWAVARRNLKMLADPRVVEYLEGL